MKITDYYIKPYKVRAQQWTGRSDFMEFLQDAFQDAVEITTEVQYPNPVPRCNPPVETRFFGPIEITLREGKLIIDPGDWVVMDSAPCIFTDEDFRDTYFEVVTESVVDMPTLEELIS